MLLSETYGTRERGLLGRTSPPAWGSGWRIGESVSLLLEDGGILSSKGAGRVESCTTDKGESQASPPGHADAET